ncbi:MAG: YaiI/YqxD family protein [Pseudomonadota bacterium]
MTIIYLDADACPVKDETYRVAGRYEHLTKVVTNDWLRVPESPLIELVLVEQGLDRADDWIAEQAGPGDVVVTADIPLAHRCVTAGARVLAPTGRAFTEASIGNDLATRNLLTDLREAGTIQGGGRPFTKQDRSAYLNALDAALQAIKRLGR